MLFYYIILTTNNLTKTIKLKKKKVIRKAKVRNKIFLELYSCYFSFYINGCNTVLFLV